MLSQLTIPTNSKAEFVNITSEVQGLVSKSSIKDGLAVIYVPHTTAGITINEQADPDVEHDILMQLGNIIPDNNNYHHSEGNSSAHIKASLMGSSVTVIIRDGKLQCGTWQGIFLCEFDGPRTRKVWVKIMDG